MPSCSEEGNEPDQYLFCFDDNFGDTVGIFPRDGGGANVDISKRYVNLCQEKLDTVFASVQVHCPIPT